MSQPSARFRSISAVVPKDFLDRERAILAEKNAGKKPEVLEKIFQSSLKSLPKKSACSIRSTP